MPICIGARREWNHISMLRVRTSVYFYIYDIMFLFSSHNSTASRTFSFRDCKLALCLEECVSIPFLCFVTILGSLPAAVGYIITGEGYSC
jgi:hypothetical protein